MRGIAAVVNSKMTIINGDDTRVDRSISSGDTFEPGRQAGVKYRLDKIEGGRSIEWTHVPKKHERGAPGFRCIDTVLCGGLIYPIAGRNRWTKQ